MTARIVKTRETCGGQARIDGTRLTTRMIFLLWYAKGIEGVQFAFPQLTREQIEAVVHYERRWYRRLRWWAWRSSWIPEFEGVVRWRGREWEVG